MMPVRTALLLFALACWDAWRLLAGRVEDGTGLLLVLVLGGGLAGSAARAESGRTVRATVVGLLLMAYAVAAITGPALLQIGLAVMGMVLIARRAFASALPPLPLLGLATLTLPILPTLDFLLAWPLRRLSALLTAGLLRMNGFTVRVEGVALDWQGKQLLFDAACSGIRMLWASLLIAHVLALVRRFDARRYAQALILGVLCAVAGNALRAASLFYLENGFVTPLQGPVAHEAVGIAAFVLLGLALAWTLRPGRERLA